MNQSNFITAVSAANNNNNNGNNNSVVVASEDNNNNSPRPSVEERVFCPHHCSSVSGFVVDRPIDWMQVSEWMNRMASAAGTTGAMTAMPADSPLSQVQINPPSPGGELHPSDRDDDEEEIFAQRAQETNFLGAEPARFGRPETGEPIAVITICRNGEIEPIGLPLRDVESMTRAMLDVLDHFDHPHAAEAKDMLSPSG